MNFVNNGVLTINDEAEGQGNVILGLVGAAAGAIGMGVVYGLVSMLVFEHSITALLVGAASGFAALKLGKGRSTLVGIAAAGFTLLGSIIGKLIIGSPEGVSWVAYHTTMFDILFCYVLAPLTAMGIVGGDQIRQLRSKLPF